MCIIYVYIYIYMYIYIYVSVVYYITALCIILYYWSQVRWDSRSTVSAYASKMAVGGHILDYTILHYTMLYYVILYYTSLYYTIFSELPGYRACSGTERSAICNYCT